MADALGKLGFRVSLKENATLRVMADALWEFSQDMNRSRGTALFYFSGQGLQLDGENYLLPVDVDFKRAYEIKYHSVQLAQVLDEMGNAHNRISLVILDAAHDNAFATEFRSVNQGLAPVDAPRGTLIAFSNAPNSLVDSDTKGDYTQHLLANLGTPGLPVEQLFKRVRAKIMEQTNGKQVPWDKSALAEDFYFLPAVTDSPPSIPLSPTHTISAPDVATPESKAPLPTVEPQEITFWKRIEHSRNPEDYQNYLRAYPNGEFHLLAFARLRRYRGISDAETSAASPPPAASDEPGRTYAVPTPPPPLMGSAYPQSILQSAVTPPPPLTIPAPGRGQVSMDAAQGTSTGPVPPPPPLLGLPIVGTHETGLSGAGGAAPVDTGPLPSLETLPLAVQPPPPIPPTTFPPPTPATAPTPAQQPIMPDPVTELLAKAKAALANNRLTTPAQDSVLKWSEQVLSIDTRNREAIGILQQALDRYLGWSSSNAARGNLKKARLYLGRIRPLEDYATRAQKTRINRIKTRIAALEAPAPRVPTVVTQSAPEPAAAPPEHKEETSFFGALTRDLKNLFKGKGTYTGGNKGPDLNSIGH
jgi:hypothetical protein